MKWRILAIEKEIGYEIRFSEQSIKSLACTVMIGRAA